jgi:hypothetical protein
VTYYLYYAGMAQDQVTEQIGLAVSEDGNNFHRVGDGLLIPVDSAKPWKSLRTCNPTVLEEDGRFLMFYQGISHDRRVSIACATSQDGVNWKCEDYPALTTENSAEVLNAGLHGTTDLIEPSVLRIGTGYRMWFITRGSNEFGNRMHHAQSADGLSWSIDRADLLTGHSVNFNGRIHYPQVVPTDSGYLLYVSIRGPKGHFSVRRGFSSDGYVFEDWEDVTPSGFGESLVSRVLSKLRLCAYQYSHGLAHSHIVLNDIFERTYFHAYHLDKERRTYMNVVSVDSWDPLGIKRVFDRSDNIEAWDSFFVADPYVLRLRNYS